MYREWSVWEATETKEIKEEESLAYHLPTSLF